MKELFLQDLTINKEHFSSDDNSSDDNSSDEEYIISDKKYNTDYKKCSIYEYDIWYLFLILFLAIICLFLFLYNN